MQDFQTAASVLKHRLPHSAKPHPRILPQRGIAMKDLQAVLPDGREFDFWEKETEWSAELCVDAAAPEGGDGSPEHPFRTIQEAADIAEPGTRVRIHTGLYRECVRPRRGGTDASHMISYEAYGDGPVILSASERVTDFRESKGWALRMSFDGDGKQGEKIYEYDIDPDLFRGYNPFCCVNILHDRLFIEYAKTDMTTYLNRRGMIFCDGEPLIQVPLYEDMADRDGTYWLEANGMKVHFRLPGDENPDDHTIEVTVREQCFAPEEPFLSFIRVRGITAAHAATGAPVPQRGAISAYRGHHWIIEDCTVDWANGVGLDVGFECWHHEHKRGEIVGYSVVRRCRFLNVGVCALAGMFAKHMLIEDNYFEGTGWQRMELSWEAGAIKLHNSVNALIRRNVFRNTLLADSIWLDCGNENNRITGNLFLDGIHQREAIFIECTRDGVNLIDNNIIWNVEGRFDPKDIPAEPGSSGWYKNVESDVVNGYGIYGEGTDHLHVSHNLIGRCRGAGYYEKPVAFRQGGLTRGGTSVDARIYNNIFFECGESAITFPTRKNRSDGNLFVNMKGGYLRVMYPEPEVCLHLPAWKEFLGFDMHGQEAWMNIRLQEMKTAEGRAPAGMDAEAGFTIVFGEGKEPFGLPEEIGRRHFVYRPEDVNAVPADPLVLCDFYGNCREKEKTAPGPFPDLAEGKEYPLCPVHHRK